MHYPVSVANFFWFMSIENLNTCMSLELQLQPTPLIVASQYKTLQLCWAALNFGVVVCFV